MAAKTRDLRGDREGQQESDSMERHKFSTQDDYKQLIIDKSVFQGTTTEKLCQFSRNHFLIIPNVLIYECATESDVRTKQKLLERFIHVISAGAYTCPGIGTIQDIENQTNQAHSYIADLKETNELREIFRGNKQIKWTEYLQELCDNANKQAIILSDVAKGIHGRFLKNKEEIIASTDSLKGKIRDDIRRLQKDIDLRFSFFLESAEICIKSIPSYAKIPKEWISWHSLRLLLVLLLEVSFQGQYQGSFTSIEHSYQDIEYVTLLCRANGLITNDQRLLLPLCKIAFPEKDVFSSLDEVPDEYRCDWK